MTPIQDKTFAQYPTFDSFLKDYSPAQLLIVYSHVTTIEESVIKNGLTLEDINCMYTQNGSMPGAEYVEKWLKFLNDFSNINKPLTETRAVSVMIYPLYKYFRLADMKLIFDKIMRSEYGPFYGSVDAQRILTSFFKYNIDRMYAHPRALTKINTALASIREKVETEQKQIIFNELKEKGLKQKELMDEFQIQCEKRIPQIIAAEIEKRMSNGEKQ
ncbi:DUF6633 family protein [Dysgonomonas sp. HGC4]|uniref:DUF6633 family protein n=1 Tax=Dysgonomonas sp. HGC4 TaxID=1658009 RepID=UPI0006836879|nr:DUF6633 family protein [Dysgonomonas sp. HGC4]MBD8349367.1 hypothetical protein [Dysgonomonas sp. HGC4]